MLCDPAVDDDGDVDDVVAANDSDDGGTIELACPASSADVSIAFEVGIDDDEEEEEEEDDDDDEATAGEEEAAGHDDDEDAKEDDKDEDADSDDDDEEEEVQDGEDDENDIDDVGVLGSTIAALISHPPLSSSSTFVGRERAIVKLHRTSRAGHKKDRKNGTVKIFRSDLDGLCRHHQPTENDHPLRLC